MRKNKKKNNTTNLRKGNQKVINMKPRNLIFNNFVKSFHSLTSNLISGDL